jgi:hypothetical protein
MEANSAGKHEYGGKEDGSSTGLVCAAGFRFTGDKEPLAREPQMASQKISLARDIHFSPIFLFILPVQLLYIWKNTCVYMHISDCIETVYILYCAFGKSLCTYERCWKWCPRASIQAWTRLILFGNTFCRSALGKSPWTYTRRWKWCPRASIQAWTRIKLN